MTKTVILDIDNTIVHTQELRDVDPITGLDFTSALRPGVWEFLDWAKEQGYVIIAVTTGVVGFQLDVLRYHNILDYFSGVYGWKDVSRTEVVAPPPIEGKLVILEDNIDTWNLGWKSSIIGKVLSRGENVIRVERFYKWSDTLDPTMPLMSYSDLVRGILEG